MTRSNKTKALIATPILWMAASMALSGCMPDDDQEVYCVDDQNRVVDDDLCDEGGGIIGGGSYFFFVGNLGGNSYRPGQVIPRNYISSGSKVAPSNRSARIKSGLPPAGKVSSGTRISGGLGAGSVGKSGGG